jgi:hypothetical protein
MVPLQSMDGGASGLRIDFRVSFSVAPDGFRSDVLWKAVEEAYLYRLLDRNEAELLVYHWQPGPGYSGPDYPHLHDSAALDAQLDAIRRHRIDLDKLHLSTGRVTLQSFVRMLITEFQVRPLRPDWKRRLDEAATH